MLQKRTARPRLCYELCALSQWWTEMSPVPYSGALKHATPLPTSSASSPSQLSTPCPIATKSCRQHSPPSLLPFQPTGCPHLKGGGQKGIREELVPAAFFTVDEESKRGLGKPGAGMGLKDEFTEEQEGRVGIVQEKWKET